jgi:chromosome segregation ATPase
MNSRISRLRESIQREEARLQFLTQERERQEQRNRLQRNADPALKEQNRKLEEQIRLNETRLEMLEARLQNGQKDESRQRETMMTLTQQINELRVALSSVATAGQQQQS